jgi:hypothetical protein
MSPIDQREGRALRLGSEHKVVTKYAVRTGVVGWVAVVLDASGRERVIVGNDEAVGEDDVRLLRLLERVALGTGGTPSVRSVC